jgi:putative zinc finger/helix-turn-helix YgiT family protein
VKLAEQDERDLQQTAEGLQCPQCGSDRVGTSQTEDCFTYGSGEYAVQLRALVPLRTCQSCGFRFLDSEAEDIQHETVCRHLGVLTPADIRAIRDARGMSRAEFARVTKLGEATLARWEHGALIQNAAYDQLLYLLRFDDNWQRVLERATIKDAPTYHNGRYDSCSELGCLNNTSPFPGLEITDSLQGRGREFQVVMGGPPTCTYQFTVSQT